MIAREEKEAADKEKVAAEKAASIQQAHAKKLSEKENAERNAALQVTSHVLTQNSNTWATIISCFVLCPQHAAYVDCRWS